MGENVKDRIVRWVLLGLLSGERIWAAMALILSLVAVILAPLVLLGWISPMIAFLVSWPVSVACAVVAHRYRGRAMLWEAMCRKAQREGAEFLEGLLRERPQVIEVVVRSDGAGRMPN
jgi:hypothetical protein